MQKHSFPKKLASLRQWLCWRLEHDDKSDRNAKVPYSPNTGYKASPTAPDTWGSLEEALQAKEKYLFTGIGFVFTEGCGIVGIDIDHCLENGKPNDIAADILSKIPPTYVEISPSGNGLHYHER